MRIIKLGLISFIIIFIVVFLISLLIPSQIRISKATNLPNERDSIFGLLKKEELWHPTYFDSVSSFRMTQLQKTIVEETDSTLVYKLQQAGKNTVVNGYQLYGANDADSLTLQWYMDFKLSWYPWEKFSTLFYEKTYGAMMEKGLANFRKQLQESGVRFFSL